MRRPASIAVARPAGGAMAGGVYRYATKAGPRWRIVYDGPPTLDPATGQVERKQKQRRGFEREKDARRALRELQRTIDDGSYVEADDITLARYLTDDWLPSIRPRRGGQRPATSGHRVRRHPRPLREGPAALRDASPRRGPSASAHPSASRPALRRARGRRWIARPGSLTDHRRERGRDPARGAGGRREGAASGATRPTLSRPHPVQGSGSLVVHRGAACLPPPRRG
jgi:hypothetical protein